MRRSTVILLPLVLSWLAGLPVRAQPAASDPAAARTALAVRQQRVQRMLQELEDKFLRLAKGLQTAEPQHAQRLLAALRQTNQRMLEERMAKVVTLLNQDQFDAADQEQKKISADIKQLLDLLLREDDAEKYQREIAQLEHWKSRLAALIKQEQEHQQRSARESREKQPDARRGEKLAAAQDATADQTGALAKEMAQNAPAPGQDAVQQAQNSMRQASDDLRVPNPAGAAPRQQNALAQLSQALGQIDQRLAELQEQMRQQALADLEEKFRQMLQRQKPVTAATARIDQKPQIDWSRADRLAVAGMSAEEGALSDLAQQAQDQLTQLGAGPDVNQVVGKLHADLQDVQSLLRDQHTDLPTQDTQKGIEKTLEQLVAAMQQAQQPAGAGQKEGPGNGARAAGNRQPSSPAQQSVTPIGAARIGDLHAGRTGNPGDNWNKLQERQRQEVLNALKDKFPDRYRELVEQYYKSLQEESPR